MALARKSTASDLFRDKLQLNSSPFRVAEIYNPTTPACT
jgi:hypothetical protein